MQGVFILLFSQRAQRHMKLLDRKPDAFFISVKSRSSLVEGEEGSYLPYWRLKIGQSPHLPLSVALHAEHKTYLIGNVAKIENSFPTFVVVRINLFRRRWGLIDERNARDTFSSMIVNEGFLASLFKKPLGLLGQRSPFLITSMTTVSRVGPYEAVVTVGVVRRLTRQTLLIAVRTDTGRPLVRRRRHDGRRPRLVVRRDRVECDRSEDDSCFV